MKEDLWYRNRFFTDVQTDRWTDRQTDSHGETSIIPPQLRWRGYTNLFSMWKNR